MPNFNPLTNAVGGNGATQPNTYYNTSPTNFGEYGFIFLSEIIDNFVAAYTGAGKILANVLKGDVNFHAHRALQELHYDTLKSCKSLEIEVCPSLKMPLPHDYVNYVKLTSVDSNGIEHLIHPTQITSHPFAVEQNDCEYVFNDDGTIKHQVDCTTTDAMECRGTYINQRMDHYYNHYMVQGQPYNCECIEQHPGTCDPQELHPNIIWPLTITFDETEMTFQNEGEYYNSMLNDLAVYCNCLNNITLPEGQNVEVTCGIRSHGIGFVMPDHASGMGDGANIGDLSQGNLSNYFNLVFDECVPYINQEPFVTEWILTSAEFNFPDYTGETFTSCEMNSNTWDNFSSVTSTTTSVGVGDVNPAVDNSLYISNAGQRYGLETSLAQGNGNYFIDCMRGNIHFSSNFSGKTIILKYISDGHGTDDEAIVPKLAEEAMYKWIAYGCAQARADVDPNTIARLKKEKFAETRKAKIRISNIKIEEISQVFRGKSKWIKH